MNNIKLLLFSLLIILVSACENSNLSKEEKPLRPSDSLATDTATTTVKSSTFSMPKTKLMMATTTYWTMIEHAKKGNDDIEAQAELLQQELEKLSPEEIIGFRLRTDQLMAATYTSEMWCAAYIANQGASDDGFEYFRLWLIAQGKTVFEKVKAKPDNLVAYVQPGGVYEFEPFWYLALNAFTAKTGAVLYDFIDDSFAAEDGYYKPITFTWKEEEPETMRKICPRLFDKFMKQ